MGQLRPGRPSFANQVSTLTSGDTLFIKSTAASSFKQVDLLRRDGSPRTVALLKGSNFVSYTGATGDVGAVFARIPGLQTALRFDGATQTWLSYSASAPSFVNTLKTFSRLDGLFLIVDGPASWGFAEAP